MTDTLDRVEIERADDLWAWLADHHQAEQSYLLVTWKKSEPQKYVSRDEVLDALLAYGWIDGRRYKLDDNRTMQLICQRKQQKWTKSYRDRIERLDQQGRLRAPGQAAVQMAKVNGTWLAEQDVDDLICPPDLQARLEAQKADGWWAQAAPSYRRNILRWLASAKKEQTRDKRCQMIADYCEKGQKIPNY